MELLLGGCMPAMMLVRRGAAELVASLGRACCATEPVNTPLSAAVSSPKHTPQNHRQLISDQLGQNSLQPTHLSLIVPSSTLPAAVLYRSVQLSFFMLSIFVDRRYALFSSRICFRRCFSFFRSCRCKNCRSSSALNHSLKKKPANSTHTHARTLVVTASATPHRFVQFVGRSRCHRNKTWKRIILHTPAVVVAMPVEHPQRRRQLCLRVLLCDLRRKRVSRDQHKHRIRSSKLARPFGCGLGGCVHDLFLHCV